MLETSVAALNKNLIEFNDSSPAPLNKSWIESNDSPNICLQGENGQGKAGKQARPRKEKTSTRIPH